MSLLTLMEIVWITFQIVVGFNLVLPLVLFIFTFFRKERKLETNIFQPDYAIIVTAYQQTSMLGQVVTSLSNLNYRNYHIYLVADNCDLSDISIVNPSVTIL